MQIIGRTDDVPFRVTVPVRDSYSDFSEFLDGLREKLGESVARLALLANYSTQDEVVTEDAKVGTTNTDSSNEQSLQALRRKYTDFFRRKVQMLFTPTKSAVADVDVLEDGGLYFIDARDVAQGDFVLRSHLSFDEDAKHVSLPLQHTLASRPHGLVYASVWHGAPCVVKIHFGFSIRLLNEAAALRTLKGIDGIVTLEKIITTSNYSALVLSPRAKTFATESKRMPRSDVIRVWVRVVEILQQVHARGVVHADISPDNILLDGGDRVIITDWDCAARLHSTTQFRGKVQYASRDMLHAKALQTECPVTIAVDLEAVLNSAACTLSCPKYELKLCGKSSPYAACVALLQKYNCT